MTDPAPPTKRSRLTFLDGLRGIAALTVVFHHFVSAFAPPLSPGARLNNPIALSPLGIAFNGLFPVFIFFVLSGFVLAGATRRSREPLLLRTGKRYLRLGLPALASCIVAWALLLAFPTASVSLSKVVESNWLNTERYVPPYASFGGALYQGTVGAFWTGELGLNEVLWTMRIEFFGSLIIYLLYSSLPWVVKISASAAILFGTEVFQPSILLAFGSGVVLEEAWDRGWLRFSRWSPILVLLGIYLGGLIYNPLTGWFYRPLAPVATLVARGAYVLAAAGAVLIVAGVLTSRSSQALLDIRPIRWLGKISFGLYLVHLPIMLTLFAAIFLGLGLSPNPAVLAVCAVAFIAASLFAGWLMTIFVDRPTLDVIRRIPARSPAPAVSTAVAGAVMPSGGQD